MDMTVRLCRPLACALGLTACVSDFSPDPWNTPGTVAETERRDAGTVDARTPAKDAATQTVVDAASAPVADASSPVERGPCDLSGRWVMSERILSTAVGADQVTVLWMYAELAQQGDALSFRKSLLCGGPTVGLGIEIKMDDSAAWPAYQAKTNYDGRTGSSVASGEGCAVQFDEGVLVRGATVATYRDKNVAMPALEDEASADAAGWEDWDADGKPGVTMNITGAAQGKIFTAFRNVATSRGTIEARSSSFVLEHEWINDRAVLSFEPPTAFVLTAAAERSPKPGANIVELTRLADDQAVGDDDARCRAIRELAPTLTPRANKIQ